MKKLLSSRYTQFVAVPAAVLVWFFWTDPSHGADTLLRIQIWAQALLVSGVAYLVAKAMLGSTSSEDLFHAIRDKNSVPAAIAYLGVCLLRGMVLVGLLMFFAKAQAQVPQRASEHLPTLSKQIAELMPGFETPHYFPALIEHESCITLTHSRCWSPTSRLKTHREEGAGLGQLTRAFNPDGTTRFDALQDARRLDPRGLNDLRWDTVYQRPDLQMRVIVLMTRQAYNRLTPLVPAHWPRLAMADAAYNGGLGGTMNERRKCGATPGCNPNEWFGHVERTCLKSTRPLYGNRSACDINRHHVHDVLIVRMPKYEGRV